MDNTFYKNYEKWEKSALQEFRESEYWHEEYSEGHLEITEDGSVYLGNSHWIKNAVTSWKDSIYYTE